MLTNILIADDPPALLTGSDLTNSMWTAFGASVILGAVVWITFKYFLGANRNVKGGVAALAFLAVLCAIAVQTDIVTGWGKTFIHLLSPH
jgi:hypothetical protein